MDKKFTFCPHCGGKMTPARDEGIERMRCAGCGFVQYINPAPAAGVLVFDEEGRVLLVRRKYDPFSGLWVIPSGYIEYGEDIYATAAREMKEETGVDVRIERIHAVESCFDDPRGNTLLVIFRGAVTGGSPEAGDDADEVGFFALDELPEIAFDCQKRILGRLRDGRS